MRILLKAILLGALLSPSLLIQAQAPAAAPQALAQTSVQVKPSDLLQRSLEELQTTLTGLKPEKWKGGTVRSEATANIASIQKDLQDTLPALLAASDAAPQSMTRALPVSRNLDALYDVLVRVVDGARIAAPGDQVDQLIQSMVSVEKARLALNDQLQQLAAGQEKQVVDLKAAVITAQNQTPPAPVCPKPPPPAPPPAAKKKVVKKKPATTPPATPTSPQTTSPVPAKPNSQ
jgi:hypothetical protein